MLRRANSEFNLIFFARALAVAIILSAGVGIIRNGVLDFYALTDRKIALVYDADHSNAQISSVAVMLSSRTPSDGKLEVEHARRALAGDPYAPLGFSILGLALEKSGDAASARHALQFAADLNLHDPIARSFSLRDALARQDVPMVLDEFEASKRMADDVGKSEFNIFVSIFRKPETREIVAKRLIEDPPWRGWMINALTRSALPISVISDLRLRIEDKGGVYSRNEIQPILMRMMKEGRHLEAYVAWLKWLPAVDRPKSPGLFNTDFAREPSGLPFDWTFEALAGSEITRTPLSSGTVLSVNFLGPRLAFKNVYQTLALPEGHYRFSGEEAAKGLLHEYGLRWRMSCLGKDARDIFATSGIKGDVFWRPFETPFKVGPNCAFQRIVLEMPIKVALDRVISGSASFRNLKISPETGVLP